MIKMLEHCNKCVQLWKQSENFFEEYCGDYAQIHIDTNTEDVHNVTDGFECYTAQALRGNNILRHMVLVFEDVMSTVLDTLTGLFDLFAGLFEANWEQMWTGVKEIFSRLWDEIKCVFSTVLDILKNIADVFFGWFDTYWQTFWPAILSAISTAANAGKTGECYEICIFSGENSFTGLSFTEIRGVNIAAC